MEGAPRVLNPEDIVPLQEVTEPLGRLRWPAGVFLIATPFIGDGGWPSKDLRPMRQVARELQASAPLYFYQGRQDETVPCSHLEMFATAFPDATIRLLKGRDHQLNDDLSEVAHDITLLQRAS